MKVVVVVVVVVIMEFEDGSRGRFKRRRQAIPFSN